ncbi:MAG: hypothetical protein WHU10_08870 [Fimbriimonadales bacterium]
MRNNHSLPEWAWRCLLDGAWLRRTCLRLTVYVCARRQAEGLSPQEAPRIVEETLVGVARGQLPLPDGVSNPETLEDWLFEAVGERALDRGEG